MTDPSAPTNDRLLSAQAMDGIIRIAIVALIAAWCFDIVRPFIKPLAWGVIIAIAVHPAYERLTAAVNGHRALAASLVVLIGLVVLIVPSIMLSGTLVDGSRQLADAMRRGALEIPPPPESVSTWPLIGQPISDFWTLASENISSALREAKDQLKAASLWLLSAAAGVGIGLAQFVFAMIIAGALLAHSSSGRRATRDHLVLRVRSGSRRSEAAKRIS